MRSNSEYIAIADDHPIVHRSVEEIVHEIYPNISLAHVFDGDDLLRLLEKENIDTVVLDIELPNSNRFSFFEFIIRKYPKLKIIVFTHLQDDFLSVKYLKNGAYCYLCKRLDEAILKEAFKKVIQGNKFLTSEQIELLTNVKSENPFSLLSNREIDVAFLLKDGKDLNEIGAELCISPSTVSTYKLRIFEKLGVKNFIEFIKLCDMYLSNQYEQERQA